MYPDGRFKESAYFSSSLFKVVTEKPLVTAAETEMVLLPFSRVIKVGLGSSLIFPKEAIGVLPLGVGMLRELMSSTYWLWLPSRMLISVFRFLPLSRLILSAV